MGLKEQRACKVGVRQVRGTRAKCEGRGGARGDVGCGGLRDGDRVVQVKLGYWPLRKSRGAIARNPAIAQNTAIARNPPRIRETCAMVTA